MTQSQEPQKNNKNQISELDSDTIKAIIVQQSQKLQIEADKIRLEEKRLAQDGKLAEKSLNAFTWLQQSFKQHGE